VEASTLSTILAAAALLLLAGVSFGVIYLTAIDWRDKRRLTRDQKGR
jgi:hypothetical protein